MIYYKTTATHNPTGRSSSSKGLLGLITAHVLPHNMSTNNSSSTASQMRSKTWTREPYFISTDPSLIPIPKLNAMISSEHMYWAGPMPEDIWRETLQNSLTFSLHHTQPDHAVDDQTDSSKQASESKSKFIGLARCITDFTTFLYLTDVHVLPEYQGQGLGRWLIACVQEVIDSMPYLRRSMLLTGARGRTVGFYEKEMGMYVHREGSGLAVMMKTGPGATLPS